MDQTTEPVSGSNKKVLYIVGGILALALVGGFMSRGVGYMGMRAAGVDVRPNMDGSATYTTDEGSVTVGGSTMPNNWPSDAPANFAGATISYSGSSNPQTGEQGSVVMYSVNGSVEAIAAHYKSQLESNGWTIEQTANMGGATIIAAKKDSRSFGVYITPGEDGTAVVQASMTM